MDNETVNNGKRSFETTDVVSEPVARRRGQQAPPKGCNKESEKQQWHSAELPVRAPKGARAACNRPLAEFVPSTEPAGPSRPRTERISGHTGGRVPLPTYISVSATAYTDTLFENVTQLTQLKTTFPLLRQGLPVNCGQNRKTIYIHHAAPDFKHLGSRFGPRNAARPARLPLIQRGTGPPF